MINDKNPDIKNLCYTLQYDTTYGRFNNSVSHNENQINIGKNHIDVFHHENITDVPWDDYGVDIVIDSSGVFNKGAYPPSSPKFLELTPYFSTNNLPKL